MDKLDTHPTITSILNFLKQNAFLSTLASLILCSLAYLYQALELHKWNIPLGMADNMKGQFLFIIIIGLFYCFSFVYLQEYLRIKLDLYVPVFITYKFGLKKLRATTNLPPIANNQKLKSKIEETTHSLAKSKSNIIKIILSVALLSFLCFLPFYTLFFVLVLDTNPILALVFCAITILSMLFEEYHACSWDTKKEIRKLKKNIKKDKRNAASYIDACEKITKEELLRLEEKRNSKTTINKASNFILPIFAILLFVSSMLVHLYSAPKLNYWIYTTENGCSYASVLEIGDSAILKRVEIAEENITLFLDDQLYLKITDKPLQYIKFKNISMQNAN